MDSPRLKTWLSFGPGTVFPQQWSWMLDLPGRGLILSRRTLASRLPLEPQHRVLEIGCGSGYYSTAVAARIPRGQLELFDAQQGMLDKARERMTRAGFTNVGFTLGGARSLPFDEQSFDVVYMVTVLGEIDDKTSFLQSARRVLKPGGVLSVSEHHPDPDYEPASTVIAQVEQQGFVAIQHLGWRYSYTLNFKRG